VKKEIMVIMPDRPGWNARSRPPKGVTRSPCTKVGPIGGALLHYANHDMARPEDLLSVVRHYELMAQKHGIQVKLNTEATAKFMRSVLHRYDVAIVACGARVDRDAFNAIPGAERIVDPIDIAAGRIKAGKNIVILGGGKIGLTLAESLKRQGAEVAVVEREKRIAGDVQPAFKWRHSSWVEALKIATFTSSRSQRSRQRE
jgi:2,4-dienoyl-CoA reductase (NADPH2)